MKKYYVIQICFDFGFWSEEDNDFRGWLKATKYYEEPIVEYSDGELIVCNSCGYNLHIASQKKPVTVVEVYENE